LLWVNTFDKKGGFVLPFFGSLKNPSLHFFFILLVLLFSVVQAQATVVMPRIPIHLLIHGSRMDLNSLFDSKEDSMKDKVKWLFENDHLDHLFSKAYNTEASFEIYWQKNHFFWQAADLNKDGVYELLYLFEPRDANEMEFVEIYALKDQNPKLCLKESGHLVGYKIHPNTGEVILFHHQYPCCFSASHTLFTIRLLQKGIKVKKKYLMASDKSMKGSFFPKSVNFSAKYHFLEKDTEVRWSSENINKNAWLLKNDNCFVRYPKGTLYKIMSRRNSMCYVLLYEEPLVAEKSFIRAENFSDIHVYGWIQQ
jgi:hypothetical protein